MSWIVPILVLMGAMSPAQWDEQVENALAAQEEHSHKSEANVDYTTAATTPIVATVDYGKWEPILQCESHGEWDYGPHSGWGSGKFEGGLQFHPSTWDAYKPNGYPNAAYQATPEQQIFVAEKVLAAQGWGAWPSCSRKAGYR